MQRRTGWLRWLQAGVEDEETDRVALSSLLSITGLNLCRMGSRYGELGDPGFRRQLREGRWEVVMMMLSARRLCMFQFLLEFVASYALDAGSIWVAICTRTQKGARRIHRMPAS